MEKKSSYTESKKQSILKYAKSHLKRIPLDVQRAEYDRIKAASVMAGETVNGYIKTAVRGRMDAENVPLVPDPEHEPSQEPEPGE